MTTVRELNVLELVPALNVTLVSDYDGLNKLASFISRTDDIGFDTETNVTKDFTQRKLRTVQIGNKEEQYVIDMLAFAGSKEALIEGQGNYKPAAWAKPVVEVLHTALADPVHRKVGTGLQFDYQVVKWNLGIRSQNFYDCHLAEMLIYSGRVSFFESGFWGMEDMMARYCGLKISKEHQTSFDLETTLTNEQVLYAGMDTRFPFAIKAGQAAHLAKFKLEKVAYEVEFPAISSFGDMKLNGIRLDAGRWTKLIDKVKEKHIDNVKVLDTFFLPVVGDRAKPNVDLVGIETAWRDEKDKLVRAERRKEFYSARKKAADWEKDSAKWEGQAAINYGGTGQVLKALRSMGFSEKQLPDTNDRTLAKLVKTGAVIKALQDYRETDKLLDTYGDSFLLNIHPVTGRVHSNINQIGASTGRTSSSDPNIQNIPKKPEWRACFVSRTVASELAATLAAVCAEQTDDVQEEYVIITIDMAGAELRILAEASGEPVWLDAFSKGWDVHSVGAEIVFGQKWKDGAEATCAYYHTGDHQKCSCKVHKQLRGQIKSINFGIAYGMEAQKLADECGITKQEAQVLLEAWRKAFPRVTAYLETLAKLSKNNMVAHTLSGRHRLFTRPTWAIAKAKLEKDGKDGEHFESRHIARKMGSMFSSVEREGKNTPIQGTNADIAKLTMGLMWERLETEFLAFLVNFVHDELVVEVPKRLAESCARFIEDCIRRAGAILMKSVTMESEYHIADHWVKD